ncbi:hypothetical protein [Streptomyces sp. S5]|uniref:hypothetical protein n=1 Tax=Streptomyces sp. S5 TaxID=1456735 RepID=UPI0013CEA3D7|nr:hypothetical protein [Streptomyces sp. S5]
MESIYSAGEMRRTLASGYASSSSSLAATAAVLGVLELMLPHGSDWLAIERVVEPSEAGPPRFGYRQATSLSGLEDWTDLDATARSTPILWERITSKGAFPHKLGSTREEMLLNIARLLQHRAIPERS